MTALYIALGFFVALAALLCWAAVRIGAWADKAVADALELQAEKGYRETREKMDEAVVADDPAAARRWLHERATAKQSGDL